MYRQSDRHVPCVEDDIASALANNIKRERFAIRVVFELYVIGTIGVLNGDVAAYFKIAISIKGTARPRKIFLRYLVLLLIFVIYMHM